MHAEGTSVRVAIARPLLPMATSAADGNGFEESMGKGDFRQDARAARAADVDEMARILTLAFLDDPVWGPAFPESGRRRAVADAFWHFMCTEALRFPDSMVTVAAGPALKAVSVWLPPGANEVSDASHDAYDAMTLELLGAAAADRLAQAGERFAAARPDEPHAYLTLLGVAPEWRGGGHGMGLLRAALSRYDALGIPTFLESSNPVNDRRYEVLGYRPRSKVILATGAVVQTYWREAQPPAASADETDRSRLGAPEATEGRGG